MENPPHPLADPTRMVSVAMGCRSGCGVDEQGGVHCWSPNDTTPVPPKIAANVAPSASAMTSPSKNNGPNAPKKPPMRGEPLAENIKDARGAVELAIGCHLCALMPDDSVYCMGSSDSGGSSRSGVRPYRFNPFTQISTDD
ncbi:MAG: hypothetical protein U0165_17615 [Polyangiaceae bacterium]